MRLAILFLLLSTFGLAQAPDSPQPKPQSPRHELLKFGGEVLFFGGSTAAQVLAEHSGAKKCKIEDARGGNVGAFGLSDGAGRRPDAADRRELKLTAAVLGAAGVAYFTHHRKAAGRILMYGGAAAYGGAFGTWWGTCN